MTPLPSPLILPPSRYALFRTSVRVPLLIVRLALEPCALLHACHGRVDCKNCKVCVHGVRRLRRFLSSSRGRRVMEGDGEGIVRGRTDEPARYRRTNSVRLCLCAYQETVLASSAGLFRSHFFSQSPFASVARCGRLARKASAAQRGPQLRRRDAPTSQKVRAESWHARAPRCRVESLIPPV